MRRVFRYILMFAAAAMIGCTTDTTDIEVVSPQPSQGGGIVYVKFTAEAAAALASTNIAPACQLSRSGLTRVDALLEAIEGLELQRVFPVDERCEVRTHRDGLDRWYVVRYGANLTSADVAARFAALGEVQTVDVDRMVKRASTRRATPLKKERLQSVTRATAMNDPLLAEQWNLINSGNQFVKDGVIKTVRDADVQCEKAWARSTGDAGVVVAVLDEGIYIDHPDLRENIWVNDDELSGSMDDNDNNGYAGDIHGYNFVNNSGHITWDGYYDSGHGTHVAGVIAAVNNNGCGVSSIAGGDGSGNGVKIMVCQIFSGNIATSILSTVRAIKYAADNGAVVLQCSWGYVSGVANTFDWGAAGFATDEQWMAGSPLEKDALDYFTHNAGSPNGPIDGGIAVFAAGNEYAAQAGYPGAYGDYVSVAATAADFTPAVYTNYGPGTRISAPGGDQDYYYDYVDATHDYGEVGCILSTLPYHIAESGYGFMEGTSMACPHVSGVFALAVSYAGECRRSFKAEELRELMYSTATPIDSYMTGVKSYCRYVADIGPLQPMQMELAPYVGQMGAGQVNAAALLEAIASGEVGREMTFPNIYLATGGSQAVAPSLYFISGETLSYEVELADTTIARATMSGSKILFEGLRAGSTTGVVRASNGQTADFTITVRNNAGGSGWL